MFRKSILLILILSPLWYSLLIGYPVLSDDAFNLKEKKYPNISVSRRCFDVGDFSQFTYCLSHSERVNGIKLINSVIERINKVSPFATLIIIVSFMIFVTASLILIIL